MIVITIITGTLTVTPATSREYLDDIQVLKEANAEEELEDETTMMRMRRRRRS